MNWLTGDAPIPRYQCDSGDCPEPVIKFYYHDKNRSVYKCCLACWTSRAVKKDEFPGPFAGEYWEYQKLREEHFAAEWEKKKQKNLEDLHKITASEPEESFYNSRAWWKLRYQALLKYGRKCMCCGVSGPSASLHVDHIKPRSIFPELALEIDNLQILCAECNRGKSNWDSTDFRPEPDGAA